MNRKKVMTVIAVYLIAGGMYFAFLSYPVEPARASAADYVLQKEERIYTTPYAIYRLYVRDSPISPAILAVATVRTPSLTSGAYSSTMRRVEGILEQQVKERYGVDIDVVFSGQKEVSVGGHETVMQEYEIHLRYLNNLNGLGVRPDTIMMDMGAYFCNERYESVIVAYAYPPIYSGDFDTVMESVSC